MYRVLSIILLAICMGAWFAPKSSWFGYTSKHECYPKEQNAHCSTENQESHKNGSNSCPGSHEHCLSCSPVIAFFGNIRNQYQDIEQNFSLQRKNNFNYSAPFISSSYGSIWKPPKSFNS